jgi:hypothetical protein
MKHTYLKETQRDMKISPNPCFPKRGTRWDDFSKRRTLKETLIISPFSKGGRGGIFR